MHLFAITRSILVKSARPLLPFTYCQPLKDYHVHSFYSLRPPPPWPQFLLVASTPLDSPVTHQVDFQTPDHISNCPALTAGIIYLVALPSDILLRSWIRHVRIESCIVLSGCAVIRAALGVLGCFGVDAVTVLAVLAGEEDAGGVGEWTALAGLMRGCGCRAKRWCEVVGGSALFDGMAGCKRALPDSFRRRAQGAGGKSHRHCGAWLV